MFSWLSSPRKQYVRHTRASTAPNSYKLLSCSRTCTHKSIFVSLLELMLHSSQTETNVWFCHELEGGWRKCDQSEGKGGIRQAMRRIQMVYFSRKISRNRQNESDKWYNTKSKLSGKWKGSNMETLENHVRTKYTRQENWHSAVVLITNHQIQMTKTNKKKEQKINCCSL